MTYDENEIRKAISIMKDQNDLFEVRIVASSKKTPQMAAPRRTVIYKEDLE